MYTSGKIASWKFFRNARSTATDSLSLNFFIVLKIRWVISRSGTGAFCARIESSLLSFRFRYSSARNALWFQSIIITANFECIGRAKNVPDEDVGVCTFRRGSEPPQLIYELQLTCALLLPFKIVISESAFRSKENSKNSFTDSKKFHSNYLIRYVLIGDAWLFSLFFFSKPFFNWKDSLQTGFT